MPIKFEDKEFEFEELVDFIETNRPEIKNPGGFVKSLEEKQKSAKMKMASTKILIMRMSQDEQRELTKPESKKLGEKLSRELEKGEKPTAQELAIKISESKKEAKRRTAKFDTLSTCVEANIEVEKDPVGYCIMTFPELKTSDLETASAKLLVAKHRNSKKKYGQINVSLPEKKKKKKTDIHLLLNTSLEGKMNKIRLNLIKTRLSSLRKASLTMDEESELKKILSSIAGEEVDDKRNNLTTKILLLEDVKSHLLEDPENKTLTQELDMKENDVKWMIEDILRDDKKSKGIFTENVMAKLTANLLVAEKFEESKHPRDEGGEFTSGEGGGKQKKDDKPSKEKEKVKKPKEDMVFLGVDDMVTDGRITEEQGEEAKRRIKTERNLAFIRKDNPKVAEAFENAIVAEEEGRAREKAFNTLPKSEQKKIQEFQQLVEETKLENSLSEKDRETLSKFKELKKLGKGKPKTGKLRTGSLVDEYQTASGDRYVTYFLLNDQTNLKGWGVTAKSIPQHIGTFKNMPFVITKTKFFPRSAYGEVTDHPSTDHFRKLGIKVGRDRPKEKNDLMQQASFQEEFRVGNIDEIIRSANGDWLAFIKIKPQFADYEMPPLVSPAIFQLNPMEPMNNISTWVGMHLAGLDESPAYGNNALYKGSCFGDKGTCMTQLSAKLPKMMAYLPPCAMRKLYNGRMRVAEMKIAVMISTDPGRAETQRQEILCRKDSKLSACPQNTAKKKKVFGMRERSAGGPGSGPSKGRGREPIKPFRQPDRPSSGTESGGRRKSIGRKPINPARPPGGKLEVFGTHPWGSRKKQKK